MWVFTLGHYEMSFVCQPKLTWEWENGMVGLLSWWWWAMSEKQRSFRGGFCSPHVAKAAVPLSLTAYKVTFIYNFYRWSTLVWLRQDMANSPIPGGSKLPPVVIASCIPSWPMETSCTSVGYPKTLVARSIAALDECLPRVKIKWNHSEPPSIWKLLRQEQVLKLEQTAVRPLEGPWKWEGRKRQTARL